MTSPAWSIPEVLFEPGTFLSPDDAREELRRACMLRHDVARFETLGESEEGRPIDAVVMGRGPVSVSLIAGNHSDEPVGPEFLRRLVPALLASDDDGLLGRYRFIVVPHTNPDGEARNRRWIERWPDFRAYLAGAFREPPGRDVEFGFPEMRVENRLVSRFLAAHGPYALHVSLHGMGQAEGALLLIERHWAYRTERLQDGFAMAVAAEGLGLHDHNRKGEKGFFYLGPGLWTTPEGEAMRSFFKAEGDDETASRFHHTSMEFVRSIGGDPLCLVTELPLFVIGRQDDGRPGVPSAYLAFKERLADVRRHVIAGGDVDHETGSFGVEPLSIQTALRLQWATLRLALGQLR